MSAPNFNDEVWSDFDQVIRRCADGFKSLNDFISFIKERIRIERIHCKSLAKLSQRSIGHNELGTLAAAFDRLRIDVIQGSNERMAFASILETDVLPEVLDMKSFYEKINGKLVQEGRRITKALAEARDRIAGGRRPESDSSSNFLASLTARFGQRDAADDAPPELDAHERLTKAEKLYDDIMGGVFEGIQANEVARIRCIRTALRKCVVFETSLVANRNYDMKDMAMVMEEVDHHSEVMHTLKHSSNRSIHDKD